MKKKLRGVKIMEITYHQEKDLLIPDIIVEEQSQKQDIGMYGRARLKFLKDHRRGTWSEMIITGKLNKHLVEIDHIVKSRVKQIIQDLAKQNKVDEKMKRANQLLWVQNMNSFKHQAEEIVYQELIYN
ncbi:MAG: TnpV protein [Clostridia bacterium]|nr:TnpV protein [Clostridia bacterium]